MSKIYIPTKNADDWRDFLADPKKQWQTGFSAKALAHCWQAAQMVDDTRSADGLPKEIASMLRPYGDKVQLLFATPEHKVPLPGASRGESQNDVFALARAGEMTFAIMIEGKVNEPFGETLGDWLKQASDGKHKRLEYICERLGISCPPPDHIYYQLLHRTCSAVIEAQRFKTDAAAMIVHSFSPKKKWFDAVGQVASLFGVSLSTNELLAIRPNSKPAVYIGWACGDSKFLNT